MIICRLVSSFPGHEHTLTVAGMVTALKQTVDQFDLRKRVPDAVMVTKVLENSTKALDIQPTLRAQDFHTLCTGENLRFETLGFLLATAGRSWLFGLSTEKVFDKKVVAKDQFVRDMLRASTACVVLCTLISPANDMMIWMLYENLLLSMLCGMIGKSLQEFLPWQVKLT
jgi:hypothetical protein